MSDDFAELLKRKICESADVTKLVDCIWNDDRCRTLIIRKIQSTPEADTLKTPGSTPSDYSNAVMSDAVFPDNLDPSQTDTDLLSTRANSPLLIRSDNAMNVDTSLGDATLSNRCQTPDENTASSYPSPSPTPGPQRKPRNSDGDDESVSENTVSRKRRRTNKQKQKIMEDSSANTPEPSSLGPPRRFRGPGKTKKTIIPDFKESRFLNLKEPLRRQISKYSEFDGIQDAFELVEAFESRSVEEVQLEPSDSLVRKLKYRLDFCDKLESKGYGLSVRAQVERYFNMVQVIAEFRRRKNEQVDGETNDNVVKEFKKELFPEKSPEQAQSSWDYLYRVGTVLFEAVQRKGYGVLVYPLRGVTKKSLHGLGLHYIGDFLDYIDRCQPGLEARICNLSYILPRLMTYGLPMGGLQVEKLPLEGLSELDHGNAFNHCFPLPAGVGAADLQLPNFSAGVSSWPEQTTPRDVVPEQDKDDFWEQLSWGGMPLENVGMYGFDCVPDS